MRSIESQISDILEYTSNTQDANYNLLLTISKAIGCFHIIQWEALKLFGSCELEDLSEHHKEQLYRRTRKPIIKEFLRKKAMAS